MEISYGELDFSGCLESVIVEVDFYTNSVPVLQPILFYLKSKCVPFQAQPFRLDAGVGS